ncbi:unnamed protein product [Parnassius mnemosyne]|uniref:Uncharacterized protein n=1 Tax=Parnassius mnemosyne TaxID=213953 RepID=A0AAV1LCX4_9NEOP
MIVRTKFLALIPLKLKKRISKIRIPNLKKTGIMKQVRCIFFGTDALGSLVCEHVQDRPRHYIGFDRSQILTKEHQFLSRMIRQAVNIKNILISIEKMDGCCHLLGIL